MKNSAMNPDWWPARQLRRKPLRKVVVCGRRLNPPLYSHVVNFPRLELPLRGTYKNQIESADRIQQVNLTPGQALYAASNCWNLPEWRPGLELLSILFGRTQLGISLISAQTGKYADLEVRKFSLPKPLTGPMPHLLNALTELQAEDGTGEVFVPMVRALMLCLENLLCQPVVQPASRAQSLLEDIRVYLQSNYQYEITRDAVAERFGVTPNHLSRLFRTHGHLTFRAYLTRVRIDRAKHLLRSYNLKLDDIAARCGYPDTPYFCHVFKRLTKCTPVEYRLKSHRPALLE